MFDFLLGKRMKKRYIYYRLILRRKFCERSSSRLRYGVKTNRETIR